MRETITIPRLTLVGGVDETRIRDSTWRSRQRSSVARPTPELCGDQRGRLTSIPVPQRSGAKLNHLGATGGRNGRRRTATLRGTEQ
jgi:hypothetical protein